MSLEEWRTVSRFPMYEASSLGRVRSRQTYNRPQGGARLMTPTLAANGYFYVRVRHDGRSFTPENTRVESRPNGRSARRCLTCQRDYDARRSVA